MLLDLIEHRPQPSKLIRRRNTQPQRIGHRHRHTTPTRPPLQHIEMAPRQRGRQQPTQRLPPATLRSHRRTQRMDPPKPVEQPGQAALIASPRPRLATGLSRQRADRALLFETMTMLIGTLPTGMVAIQPRSPRTTNHHELHSTPRTGPMSRTRMRDDRHTTVLRHRCDTPPPSDRASPNRCPADAAPDTGARCPADVGSGPSTGHRPPARSMPQPPARCPPRSMSAA